MSTNILHISGERQSIELARKVTDYLSSLGSITAYPASVVFGGKFAYYGACYTQHDIQPLQGARNQAPYDRSAIYLLGIPPYSEALKLKGRITTAYYPRRKYAYQFVNTLYSIGIGTSEDTTLKPEFARYHPFGAHFDLRPYPIEILSNPYTGRPYPIRQIVIKAL